MGRALRTLHYCPGSCQLPHTSARPARRPRWALAAAAAPRPLSTSPSALRPPCCPAPLLQVDSKFAKAYSEGVHKSK